MYVVDSATMRRMDAATIEGGVPGLTLMERAGEGAARGLLRRRGWLGGTTLVVCGKGNNGGDGLVVARLLHAAGADVVALLLSTQLTGDAATNLQRAHESGVELVEIGGDPASALREFAQGRPGRVLVDAVLGTGFQPPLRPSLAELCAAMESTGRTVVALDCPSGLDATTGAADLHTPTADLTFTFGAPKWGLVLAPGRAHCGRIEVVDLGFPTAVVETEIAACDDHAQWIDRPWVAARLPRRAIDAHKYQVGSVLVVGASAGMSGAVTLACRAAGRAGAGLIEAVVPRSQRLSVDVPCVESLVHAAPETDLGGISRQALALLRERVQRRSAVLLGPGLGGDPETAALVLDWLQELEAPAVVDADALNAGTRLGREPVFPARSVLTPHSGELARLLGCEPRAIEAQRRERVREAADRFGTVVLHKGAPTFVAAPGGRLAVVGAGGPGLATAGSGDVLAGVAVALLAAGLDPFEAACAAAWIHGRAGDRCERRWGVSGVLAGDLVDAVARVRRRLEEGWH